VVATDHHQLGKRDQQLAAAGATPPHIERMNGVDGAA